MKASVVGGGLAGLAAAVELTDSGAEVTLYEARSRLGGATFSFERNGLWLDNGQHVALRCCTAYLGFLQRIGSDHLLPLQPRLRVPVLREGRAPAFISRTRLPAPLHPCVVAPALRAARAARAARRDPRSDRLCAASTPTTRRSTARASARGFTRTGNRTPRSRRSGT